MSPLEAPLALAPAGSGARAPSLYFGQGSTSYRAGVAERVRAILLAAADRQPQAFISDLLLFAGTGGTANAYYRVISTSDLDYIASSPPHSGQGEGEPPTTARMLATVRAAFGTNVTQTAHILRVERPTIYSWIREESTPRVSSYQRLIRLYALARDWNRRSTVPVGQALHQPIVDNYSLFELLQEERLREFVLSQQLRLLAQSTIAAPVSQIWGFRERLGLPSVSANNEATWLTRQSLGPES